MDALFLTDLYRLTDFYRRRGDQESRRLEFMRKILLNFWSPGLL
jgi:hypothetical protein